MAHFYKKNIILIWFEHLFFWRSVNRSFQRNRNTEIFQRKIVEFSAILKLKVFPFKSASNFFSLA